MRFDAVLCNFSQELLTLGSCISIIVFIQGGVSNALAVFTTPFTTLYHVVFQTAGEIDANGILYNSTLHYRISTYALFLIFVIAVPILFNNFLVKKNACMY